MRHICKRLTFVTLVIGLTSLSLPVKSQDFTEQNLPNPDNIPSPVFPVPTERQLNWMESEFYGF